MSKDGSIVPKNNCNEFSHEVIAVVTFDENGQATIRLKTNFGMKAGGRIHLKNFPGVFMEIISSCGTEKNGHAII